VANDHDGFLAAIFFEDLAEVGKVRLWTQAGIQLQLAFVSQLVSDQRRSLRRTFERAGDDHVYLDVECRERASDVTALLDTLFVQSTLLIFFWIDQVLARTGVAQKINDHIFLSYSSRYRSAFSWRLWWQQKRRSLALRDGHQKILSAEKRVSLGRTTISFAMHRLPSANVSCIFEQYSRLPFVR